jgi:hypothetical protein
VSFDFVNAQAACLRSTGVTPQSGVRGNAGEPVASAAFLGHQPAILVEPEYAIRR